VLSPGAGGSSADDHRIVADQQSGKVDPRTSALPVEMQPVQRNAMWIWLSALTSSARM